MFCYVNIEQYKKQICLFVLLAFSTLVHAEPVDVMDSAGNEAKTDSEFESNPANVRLNYKYPRWPTRMMAKRDRIPPPPPGPYMSSALSGFTVEGLSFGGESDFGNDFNSDFNSIAGETNDTKSMFDSSSAAIDQFSPDKPWPKDLQSKNPRLPNRWMPDSGYRYVNPGEKQKTTTELHNRIPFMGDDGYKMPGAVFPKNRLPESRFPKNWSPHAYRPNMKQQVERRMPSMGTNLTEPGLNNYGIRANNPGYRNPESSGTWRYR